MKIKTIDQALTKVETIILNHLSMNEVSKTIEKASAYSIAAGGKRFRPRLLLSTLEALSVPLEKGLSAAAAIEMIHTYSLIHDDLPSMDDDDLRRGRPTNHKVFGEATAILAGDNLLNESIHIVLKDDTLTNDEKVKVLKSLMYNSGQHGMISGQMLDIEAENQSISFDELTTVHRFKTGALITASVDIACQLTTVERVVYDNLIEFSEKLGILFQIRDDIMDVTNTTEEMGKHAFSDEKKNKSTYVSTYGLDGARRELGKYLDAAHHHVDAIKNEIDTHQLNEILKQFT